MRFILVMILAFFKPLSLWGAEVMAYTGETVTILVDPKTGTLVEFPKPVMVVGSAQYFGIDKVVTEVNENERGVNVRIVNVRPKDAAIPETVPFILSDHKSIHVRFVVRSGADKHYKVSLPKLSSSRQLPGLFMDSESKLMTLMLRDEGGDGFSRNEIHQALVISGYDDLELSLERRFEGKGLIGYTFKLINTSDKKVVINSQVLNFGSPNRAVLLQIDHETLEPCALNRSADPSSPSCLTAVRLVARGEHFVTPSSKSDLPFVMQKEARP